MQSQTAMQPFSKTVFTLDSKATDGRPLLPGAGPIPSSPVRWLVHGTLTEAVPAALVRHGDKAQAPADIGLADDAAPEQVFEAAQAKQLDVVTSDPKLAN